MIEYLLLLLAIPLGVLLAGTTKDEKRIYSKKQYFPTFLWLLGIGAVFFFTVSKPVAMTLAFLFVLIFSWWKA